MFCMGVKLGLSYYENRLRVFQNRVLMRMFRSNRKCREPGEDCIMSFITGTLHRILLG